MLAKYTDVMCELVQDLENGAAAELVMEDATTSASNSSASEPNDDDSKRKPTIQLSPLDAKKAASVEVSIGELLSLCLFLCCFVNN